MSTHFEDWAVDQYNTAVQHLAQQEGPSKLRAFVDERDGYSGEGGAPVNQLQPFEFQDAAGKFNAMPRVDPTVDRAWVYPEDKECPVLVDRGDDLRTILDLQSPYVGGMANAGGRQIDDIIIPAFFATRNNGKKGGSTQVFPASQKILASVGGSTGMNVVKLETMLELFATNEVDLDQNQIYVGIGPKQNTNLLREIEIARSDYNKQAVVTMGKVRSFMGIEFIHSTRFEKPSTERLCPAWIKRGIHLGVWQDIMIELDERPDLSKKPNQIYGFLSMGATRTEEVLVAQIECTE